MRQIIFLFSALFSIAAYGEDISTPIEKTVQNFYTALAKHQSDLHKSLESLSPYLSQNMNMLVKQAEMANDSYINRFPTDAPPFEHGNCVFYGGGDCDFSSYKLINKIVIEGKTAKGSVELALIDRNHPLFPPYRWRNTVTLVWEQGKWVIADIDYFDSRASDNLKSIIKDAQ